MPASTDVAAAVPDSSTAVELVREARALKQVYQQTWRIEDVEARIRCYLRAIDLLYEASKYDDRIYASVPPALNDTVAEELVERNEDSHRTCTIGTCLCNIT